MQETYSGRIPSAGPDSTCSNTARPAPDGGMIAVGSSTSNAFPDKTEDAFGGLDYWIVKVDDGKRKLGQDLGGSAMMTNHLACITTDGDYVIAGYSNSGISGNKTEMNRCRRLPAGETWECDMAEPCSTAPGRIVCRQHHTGLRQTALVVRWERQIFGAIQTTRTPAWTAIPSGINNKTFQV